VRSDRCDAIAVSGRGPFDRTYPALDEVLLSVRGARSSFVPPVDPSPRPRYVPARPSDKDSPSAGQELNIAQPSAWLAALRSPGFALFVLGKVTAGLSGNER